MEKTGNSRLKTICGLVVVAAILAYIWKDLATSQGDVGKHHITKTTPTRSLMDVVSTHTTKILEAIMIGDFDTVIKEAGAVSTMSEGMIKDFFPEGGKVGDWFKETGKNPENPADVKAVKDDFEKYMKAVADASKNIAETAKKYTIVETYKSFDAMLQKACFACHTVYRPLWPEWMKITGG